jgi:predicted transposase/invertase (TIGR01784 family)
MPRKSQSEDLKEVIMNLAPAYEQWYEKTIAEGCIKVARRMLSKNMPLEEIAELTDLTLAQIKALQAENR